ncbi:DNRLRE domain-containing protein [Planctomycetes bacterium TBK1r]|uniref:PEP-CTERM protein-sorting domain-containing protein n=1 Tax=Stieleria magnilauensis TaxID=2527963 RepID=A0ABX5XP05_9BACT|nr:hypothetical protein TBK1r_26800 [Planctomycetes bacterium TBK1r]
MRIVLFFVVAFFASSALVNAATVVVLNPSQDNSIYENSPGNSNGSGDFFFAGQNASPSPRRALIQFDLTAIPTDAVITGASLSLFASQVASSTAYDVSLYRLESAWGESTSDANGGEGAGIAAATGDATWTNTFFNDQFWTTPGGDFVADASATTTVSTTGAYTWSSPSMVSEIQGWVDGSVANFGWIAIGNEAVASSAKRFNSRSNGSNNPALTVEFTAVPEPSSACLLGALGLGLLVRRRR